MSEEPRQNKGRGSVDRKLVKPPSNVIAGRPKAALFLSPLGCSFFIISLLMCLLCLFVLYVIVALWPPALQFQLHALLLRRGLVDRKLVQAPPPHHPVILLLAVPRRLFYFGSLVIFADRLKAALLFWFFGDFRCGVFLLFFMLYIYI